MVGNEHTATFMNAKKYSGYTALIYKADDPPSGAAKGEDMKTHFPGADYELVDGDPCGQCSHVDGTDAKICTQIQEWINGRG